MSKGADTALRFRLLAAGQPPDESLDSEVSTLSAGITEGQALVDDIVEQYRLVLAKLDQATAEIRDAESWAARPHAGTRADDLVGEAQAVGHGAGPARSAVARAAAREKF